MGGKLQSTLSAKVKGEKAQYAVSPLKLLYSVFLLSYVSDDEKGFATIQGK